MQKPLTNIDNSTETIVALATPPGRGGVAVIRISGPLVQHIAQLLLKKIPTPRFATYCHFIAENDETLDAGLALYFPGPNSFTGEDVLELQGHGGMAVVDLLIQRIIKLGARLSQPGEFSLRAFQNNKIDLVQAEAIADLINASSTQAARSAMRSLQGEFSKNIEALVTRVIHLRMYVEAAIDFAEEEIDFLKDEQVSLQLNKILEDVTHIIQQATQGSLLRDGISVVIAGKPNVGKSSLLNCLSQKETAIVTDIPGTTRDVLRENILLDGIPLHIVDTAGLRESHDVVEQEGIRRAHVEMSQADIILQVVDASAEETIHSEIDNEKIILIRNKIDLVIEQPSLQFIKDQPVISISAKKNLGMDLLKNQIKKMIGFTATGENTFLARRRHIDALERALEFLKHGQYQLQYYRAGELLAEDLRYAQKALSEITGEFTTDDLLGKIFSSFCVGK